MGTVLHVAIKDLRLLVQDRAGLFFTFFFPIFFAIFFGLVFGGGGGGGDDRRLAVVVVDLDATSASKRLVERLRAAPELRVSDAASRQAGSDRVLAGEAAAYIAVPEGFGRASAELFVGSTATLELGVDPSRKAEGGMLTGILSKYAFQGLSDAFTDPDTLRAQLRAGREALAAAAPGDVPPVTRVALDLIFQQAETLAGTMPAATASSAGGRSAEAEKAGEAGAGAWQPVKIESVAVSRPRQLPPNAFSVSFPQGMIWGILGTAAGFAASLASERRTGTLARLRLAPVSLAHILAGKSLACFMTAMTGSAALLGLGVAAFGVRVGDPGALAVMLACACFGFTGVMMLIAGVARTEAAASGGGWAVLMVLAMLGGAAVPMMFMPGWIQTLALGSPVRWTLLGIEGAVWRGWSAGQFALPCAVMLGVGVAGLGAGIALVRWQERV